MSRLAFLQSWGEAGQLRFISLIIGKVAGLPRLVARAGICSDPRPRPESDHEANFQMRSPSSNASNKVGAIGVATARETTGSDRSEQA